MLRPWPVAALLLMTLAGCSSGPEALESVPTSTASKASTTAVSTPPVPRTDTLYLLDAPHMAGTLPDDAQTIRTAVPTDLEYVSTGSFAVYPHWTLPRPELAELDIDLRLWIEVKGTVTNPPRGAFNCFWHLSFFLEHADGSRTGLTNYCLQGEPPVVPTGVRLVEASIVQTPDMAFQPSDRLGFDIGTSGAYGPDGSVEILSGTPESDSSLTITGLQLPIDTRTLTH